MHFHSSRVPYSLLALLIWVFSAAAEEIRVVAREDAAIAVLTPNQVADLFLGRGEFLVPLTPVEPNDEALRKQFYRSVADMSLKGVRAYWAQRVFTGRGHPPELLPAEAAMRKVLDDPHAVTFVLARQQARGTKVLLAIDPEVAP